MEKEIETIPPGLQRQMESHLPKGAKFEKLCKAPPLDANKQFDNRYWIYYTYQGKEFKTNVRAQGSRKLYA